MDFRWVQWIQQNHDKAQNWKYSTSGNSFLFSDKAVKLNIFTKNSTRYLFSVELFAINTYLRGSKENVPFWTTQLLFECN